MLGRVGRIGGFAVMSTSAQHGPGQPGLLSGAIGLFGDTIASVANVAPSSSIAFTLALLVSFAGLASPLAVLVAGILMLLCACGYSRFNDWTAHAGAPYIWIGSAVKPVLGYGMGIMAIVASTVANIGNITLAGTYLLSGVFSPGTTFPNFVVWIVSAVVMAAVVFLTIRGIRPTIAVQFAIIAFEYTIVIIFVILALRREFGGLGPGVSAPSIQDFLVGTSPNGFSGVANAGVICGFLYAGWEVPLILSEESRRPNFNPGRGAILGVIFLTIWYTFLTLVFEGVASQKEILANGTDVLAYAGNLLMPQPWARLLPLAVFSAVFATTQLQLAESARIAYAMGRDRLLPAGLGIVHHAFHTPWVATLVLGCIPPLFLIPYLASSAATTAIGYVISADGMIYLVMYFAIAVGCVWYYRKVLTSSLGNLLLTGVAPLVGGLSMLGLFIFGLTTQIPQVRIVAGAIVALCVVSGFVAIALLKGHPYFAQKTVAHEAGTTAQAGGVS